MPTLRDLIRYQASNYDEGKKGETKAKAIVLTNLHGGLGICRDVIFVLIAHIS